MSLEVLYPVLICVYLPITYIIIYNHVIYM